MAKLETLATAPDTFTIAVAPAGTCTATEDATARSVAATEKTLIAALPVKVTPWEYGLTFTVPLA
jgi:hypothetical protein